MKRVARRNPKPICRYSQSLRINSSNPTVRIIEKITKTPPKRNWKRKNSEKTMNMLFNVGMKKNHKATMIIDETIRVRKGCLIANLEKAFRKRARVLDGLLRTSLTFTLLRLDQKNKKTKKTRPNKRVKKIKPMAILISMA